MIRAPFFRLGVAAVAGTLAVTGLAVPATAAVDRGTVQGTYTTDSGEPIANAYISVYSADQDWLRDGSTDDSGHFTLRNVNAGGIKLQFQNNGIMQWAHDATDIEGATEFTVVANQTLTVNESQLPTGTIAGTLKEATGEPAAWYNVVVKSLADWGSTSTTFVGEDGRYSLAVLPGNYKVSFQREATEQWATQKSSEASADTFTVVAGQTVEVDDTILPAGSLAGRLTTADGAPLADKGVTLHRPYDPTGQDGDGEVAYAYTDGDGNYEFVGALPGDYRISFAGNETGPRQWLRGTIDPARAAVYTVEAGRRTDVGVEAQLRTSTVQGQLTDPTGDSVEGYTVVVSQYSEEGWESYSAITGPDGSWQVDEVLPSTYVVMFENPTTSRRQWAYGQGTEKDAERFVVAAGATVTVNDTWLPGATLVIDAVDAVTKAPVSDFCAYLWTANGGGCTSGSELTIADLAGGEHALNINTGDRSFYLGQDDVRATLTPGETTTVTVALALGGKAAMTVTDTITGEPVNDTCFVLIVPGQGGLGDGYGDCTNAAGKSSTRATAPGTYQLFAIGRNDYGHQWVGKTGGTGDQREAAKITIRPGKVTKAPAIHLDKATSVTGIVTGDDGQPIPYADVAYSAWGYGVGPSHDTNADENGLYTLGRLGPYAWPLVFTTADYPRQWSGGTGNRFQAELVQLTAGAPTTYNMAMKRGSSVKGVVSIAPGAQGDQWRLTAMNAATGDPVAMSDAYNSVNGAYEMLLAGGQQIKIHWVLSGEGLDWQQGFYDNATDLASATKVSVPKTGSKTLNVVVGRP